MRARKIKPKRALKTKLGTQTSAEQRLALVGKGLSVDMSEGGGVVLAEQVQIGHIIK